MYFNTSFTHELAPYKDMQKQGEIYDMRQEIYKKKTTLKYINQIQDPRRESN